MNTERPIEATDLTAGGIHCTTATHPGARRSANQDAVLSRPDLGLWAVADGAGGHSRGEAAAQAIVDALDSIPPGLTGTEMLGQVRLRLLATHRMLFDAAGDDMMASTVVVLIIRDGHFACLWVGDSRAYLARAGAVEALTIDHSLVQDLLDQGHIGPEEAKDHPDGNIITRAIGAGEADPMLDKRTGEIQPGDRFLLCSDGVCKTLPEADLAHRLLLGAPATDFVTAALDRSVSDNVTVVTINLDTGQPLIDPPFIDPPFIDPR